MIPGTVTKEAMTSPLVGKFINPSNLNTVGNQYYCIGGKDIGDTSEGLSNQLWVATLNLATITIKTLGLVKYTLTVPTTTTDISFTFTQNMSIVIAYQVLDKSYLYYFDSTLATYTTREFNNTSSCKVFIDDNREFSISISDVIFTYISNGRLLYRKQRDSYNVETQIGTTSFRKLEVGINNKNRIQFNCK